MHDPTTDHAVPAPAAPDEDTAALARRRVAAIEVNRMLSGELAGDWVDGEDLADRDAFARSRSAISAERPPHW